MPAADLILFSGKVHTLNAKQPRAEAIAIKNGRIVRVGSNLQVLRLKTEKTRSIDLKGKTVLPGFVDCHMHLRAYAQTLEQIELRDVTSIRQLQRRLREAGAEAPPDAWITARGFDEERFHEKRLPTRHDLDMAVSDRPVFITRVCGHLSVANTKALEHAHITTTTHPAETGIIEKNPETGEPTGILLENAQDLVSAVIPKPDEKEVQRIFERAFRRMAEKGLTGVHCIIKDPKDVAAFQALNRQHKLKLRVYLLTPIEYLDQVGNFSAFENSRIRTGSIKIFADGSLGARTAALCESYSDDKKSMGIMIYKQEKLESIIEKLHDKGFQLAVHAIGDHAIESVLDAFEKAFRKTPRKDHRHRIEHASVINSKLLMRMKKLGIVASVQPHFVISDFWLTKKLGKRRVRWTYAFKSLIKAGICVCGGSDGPIEPIDPLLGIWAAVARRSYAKERLSVDEAIRLYTVNAAYASFQEDVKGTIEEGRLADLIVLTQDPTITKAYKIRSIEVDMTIVDGEIVFARKHPHG